MSVPWNLLLPVLLLDQKLLLGLRQEGLAWPQPLTFNYGGEEDFSRSGVFKNENFSGLVKRSLRQSGAGNLRGDFFMIHKA